MGYGPLGLNDIGERQLKIGSPTGKRLPMSDRKREFLCLYLAEPDGWKNDE